MRMMDAAQNTDIIRPNALATVSNSIAASDEST